MVSGSMYTTLLEGTVTWSCRLMLATGGLCGFALTLLYMFQDKLLYVPQLPGLPKEPTYTPDMWNIIFEDIWLEAADGIKLHAWFLWLPEWTEEFKRTRPVIMFFQENAGNMGFRIPYLKKLMKELQCPVFALSYRGYGFSDGRPSQKGIVMDAHAAVEHVRQRTDVDSSRIVLFGRSLGGAVAIYTAAANQSKITALIVENTFTSVEDMSGVVVPPLKYIIGQGKFMNFIVRNKWHNLETIGRIKDLPIMLMVSMKDEMVPCSHMMKLKEQVSPSQLTWLEFPNGRHMDAYESCPGLYWPGLQQFIIQHVADIPSAGRRAVTRPFTSMKPLEDVVQGLEIAAEEGGKKLN